MQGVKLSRMGVELLQGAGGMLQMWGDQGYGWSFSMQLGSARGQRRCDMRTMTSIFADLA